MYQFFWNMWVYRGKEKGLVEADIYNAVQNGHITEAEYESIVAEEQL